MTGFSYALREAAKTVFFSGPATKALLPLEISGHKHFYFFWFLIF